MPAGIPSSEFPRVDVPDVREVFADSIGLSSLDGNILRLEFCVTRLDDVSEAVRTKSKPTGNRHVVARLVMNTEGAVELVNVCATFANAMKQLGLIQVTPTPGETKKPN